MFSLNSGLVRLGALAVLLFQLAGTSEARHLPANPQWTKLAARRAQKSPAKRAADATTFPLFNFTQPLDHFVDTGFTFQQRYWLSDRHYKPGGPVIVFEAGEGPGDERMPILDTGILNILANATNGLAIVLEHRYYGTALQLVCHKIRMLTNSLSRGVGACAEFHDRFSEVRHWRYSSRNHACQSLIAATSRWLNNEQAAADSANFIDNVTFPGIPGDLTAPGTPWIYYGVST